MIQKIEAIVFIQHKKKILLDSIEGSDLLKPFYFFPGGVVEFGDSVFDSIIKNLKFDADYKTYNSVNFYSQHNQDEQLISVLFYYYFDNPSTMNNFQRVKRSLIWVSDYEVSDYLTGKYLNMYNDVSKNANVVAKPLENSSAKLFTDGGSRGNPGPSALGYVVYGSSDNVVVKSSKYLGVTTNNQAEYQAVKYGLEDCFSRGYSKVEVYLDSQLVANQMNGVYKIKNRDLWPIHQAIKEQSKKFKNGVSFTYIPRELNKEADAMVNIELDSQE